MTIPGGLSKLDVQETINCTQGIINDFANAYTVVPEPGAVIAGALLLLPFGASTLRVLRKSRKA